MTSRWFDIGLALASCVLFFTLVVTSSHEAFRVILAAEELNRSKSSFAGTWDLEVKRKIQKSLLGKGVYIPLEMIVSTDDFADQGATHLCKNASQYVLLPLRFQVPFYGTIVKDWCWGSP